MAKTHKITEIVFNAPDKKTVNRILQKLFTSKLTPVAHQTEHATYHMWDGELIDSKEYTVKVRCLSENTQQLVEIIEDNHIHPLPSIVWTELQTTEGYRKWVSGDAAYVT